MDLRREQQKRIARAPAKLNLYLEVFGRRGDGFHELETLMVPIRLFDTLSFGALPSEDGHSPGPIALSVQTSGCRKGSQSDVPAGEENLVTRALKLFRERAGCILGARVELAKRIPTSAGLGGASSDAATGLLLANRDWNIHWSTARLAEVAAEIGSDVPFFLYRGAALCRGRGERVERVCESRPMHFVVVKPPVELSTADVYRAYAAGRSEVSCETITELAIVSEQKSRTADHPRRWMRNRLQSAAAALSPWIDRLRSTFAALDFEHHQLSGSGSAYFGVCRHAQHARRLASILRQRQLGLVYATRSCA